MVEAGVIFYSEEMPYTDEKRHVTKNEDTKFEVLVLGTCLWLWLLNVSSPIVALKKILETSSSRLPNSYPSQDHDALG